MITTKNTALIGLSAILAFALTQGCGSDDSGGGSAGSGVAGAAAGSVGVSGGGGSTAAGSGGASAGAVGVSGGGSGGAAAGSGGASAGSGGATGGSGGAAAGAGGGSAGSGGAAPKFSEVSAIINASCKGNGCHTGGEHINFTTPGAGGLYGLLTTTIPVVANGGIEHCQGSKLVDPEVPANSFLQKVIAGNNQTCKHKGNDQNVPRMPYMCSTTGNNPRPCLTAAQIKTITDWVAAGGKND